MARSKRSLRTGGVNAWRRAADDGVAYRPVAAAPRARDLGMPPIPTFTSEQERYGWEMGQWRNNTVFGRGYTRKWMGADSAWHVGPPFYPGAPVFEHPKPKPAFVMATAEGYIAPRRVADALGFSRYKAKRLIDAVAGILDVGFATYPCKKSENTKWNCRLLHTDCLDDMRENEKLYLERLRTLIKGGSLPGVYDYCKVIVMNKDGEKLHR